MMNDELKATLPVGATEASILRYEVAKELASLCPPPLGEEIALTGSAAHGWSDDTSDIEINFWAEQIPTAEEQLAWLREIGATNVFPESGSVPDGSIMTTFTWRGCIIEAEWQSLMQQEQVLQTLLAAQSDSNWLILNGEMISSAVTLRSNGALAHWKDMVANYPDALIGRVVASASEGWMFAHWVALRWAFINRGEQLALHNIIVNDIRNALRILWAVNRQWGPQTKWIRHSSDELKLKPERLVERIEASLAAPPAEAVAEALALVLEILALVPDSIDVSKPLENIRASLQANIVQE